MLGIAAEPIPVSSPDLIFGEHRIAGKLTGSTADTEDTLAFSVLQVACSDPAATCERPRDWED